MEREHRNIFMRKHMIPAALLLLLSGLYLLFKYRVRIPLVLFLDELLLVFGFFAAWYDIREQKVPNLLVLLMPVSWLLVLLPQLLLSPSESWPVFWRGLAGFVFSAVMMLGVYFISRKGLGGGDVKFLAAAGCYLGITDILSAVLFGSILAAVVSIGRILAKKMKRTDSFPFVPYLYFGMLLILFLS